MVKASVSFGPTDLFQDNWEEDDMEVANQSDDADNDDDDDDEADDDSAEASDSNSDNEDNMLDGD